MLAARPSPLVAPNLVLGLIAHYTFAQVEPFLSSLRRTGYTGEIVFFYHGILPGAIHAIRRFNVTLIPFRNARHALFRTPHHERIERFARHYHRAKWPFYALGFRFFLSAAKQRYFLYHRYLRNHGKRYHRVLLTDTRDVFFQSDPFATGPTEDLLFFEESHPLGLVGHNSNWIRAQLGQATLDRLASRPTLCSGTTIGTPPALCSYLKRILQLMKRASGQDAVTGDQALHNAVVYEGLSNLPFSIRRCPNGTAQVSTLTDLLDTAQIPRAPTGEVLDATGNPVPIVHQYDRHPEIQAALLASIR